MLCEHTLGGYETIKKWNVHYWNELNGKVVASFIIDKVEEIKAVEYDDYNFSHHSSYELETDSLNNEELCEKSCLTPDSLEEYLNVEKERDVYGYAIHITNLEIFDKPKELSEFGIKKAPQSWMYIREENESNKK